jgi:hypothetical protein
MPAGKKKARTKARPGKARAAKRANAAKDGNKRIMSLRDAVLRLESRKDGTPSPIGIVVGDEIGQAGHKYDRDITFAPTQIHLREAKGTATGKPDSVKWELSPAGKFELKFKGDSPFQEGGIFTHDRPVGTVKDGASVTNYEYELTLLELNGKIIHIGPSHCPEIIIQR